MHTRRATRVAGILALTVALGLAACDDDDPTGPGTIQVRGLALEADAETLVEIDGTEVTGSLELDAGTETAAFDVVVFDMLGEILDPAGHHLVVEVDDEAIAAFIPDGIEPFRGSVEGVAAGATTLVIKIVQGTEGAPGATVYTSPEIDVAVN